MDIFVKILSGLLSLLKYPLYAVFIVIAVFYLLVSVHYMYGYHKGRRIQKGQRKVIKKRSVFLRLFWDLPRQYVDDIFNRETDYFRNQGCVVFCGRQGNGKTISMVHFAMLMQEEYPLAKCITNLNYKYQDVALTHWKQLIDYKNGKRGVIVCMDELQNWFSSNQSKSFPPEMLQVITQNRKNRRIILGTAQNFYLLAKAIRSQATEVRECVTFLGCLTVVRKREPILNSEGDVEEWKNRGWYFYVHTKKLRGAYDTYKTIESLAKSGFQERQQVAE